MEIDLPVTLKFCNMEYIAHEKQHAQNKEHIIYTVKME